MDLAFGQVFIPFPIVQTNSCSVYLLFSSSAGADGVGDNDGGGACPFL
jgi:hypothetical protein